MLTSSQMSSNRHRLNTSRAIGSYRSVHLKMYNKYFYLSIFGFLKLLYVYYEHICKLGRLFYKILVSRKSLWRHCGGRVKHKFCGVVSLLSFRPHVLIDVTICPLTFSFGQQTDISVIWLFEIKPNKIILVYSWSRHGMQTKKCWQIKVLWFHPFLNKTSVHW